MDKFGTRDRVTRNKRIKEYGTRRIMGQEIMNQKIEAQRYGTQINLQELEQKIM